MIRDEISGCRHSNDSTADFSATMVASCCRWVAALESQEDRLDVDMGDQGSVTSLVVGSRVIVIQYDSVPDFTLVRMSVSVPLDPSNFHGSWGDQWAWWRPISL